MRLIGNVEKDAQVRAVASGALSTGDTVLVNSDGTVSVVEGVAEGAGTPVVFEAAGGQYLMLSSAFDSNANKVVVAYEDAGNSSYGTAVVGTVSGSSISFGTPVVFESANSDYFSVAFDSSSNKIVISYRDNGNSFNGTAIVGTVSGTSISFGSPVVFNTSGEANDIGSAFDSTSSKVIIAYEDQGNSNYGTAIVGTVSGTSISFGSETVFSSVNVQSNSVVYDANSNKVVIAYKDQTSSGYGTAVVGTVSGTSISFGTPVVFQSSEVSGTSATFDSTNNKVFVAYRNDGNSNYGTAVVGAVSGTSISFGTAVVFSAASSDQVSTTFDSNSNKVVIAYADDSNSSRGTIITGTITGTTASFDTPVVFDSSAVSKNFIVFDSSTNKAVVSYWDGGNSYHGTSAVFTVGSTNLTAENFLGFAAHTYADTQSALVNSTCTVDRNQTSLTAGQTYYVQTDGSLGTTAADPSVVAGTAISSTEIIVKG